MQSLAAIWLTVNADLVVNICDYRSQDAESPPPSDGDGLLDGRSSLFPVQRFKVHFVTGAEMRCRASDYADNGPYVRPTSIVSGPA